jgi:hypothetical protein
METKGLAVSETNALRTYRIQRNRNRESLDRMNRCIITDLHAALVPDSSSKFGYMVF